jgi:NADH:ubiquinone oxidoreductase subunit E
MKAVCGIARSISKELLVGNTRTSLAGESHMETENILDIIRKSQGKAAIISILEDIQEKYTYLPEEALRLVATETGCSLTDVYGVAIFTKPSA